MKSFSGSYAGFIVARPLPKAIIGRTVVRTLPTQTDEGKRRYLAVVDTPVNLFGLRLTVEKSLPFQQQDRAVSACATVALWSAFFRTAAMFGTPVARPAAITRAATTSLAQDRALPSTGLTLEQICDAIHGNGLDPEVFALGEGHNIAVLSLIRAYLEAGLPVILGVKNGDSRHAVTAVGYRLSGSPAIARELIPQFHDTPSVARWIDMLFCHDDNVAPFAEFGIRGDPAGGHIRLTSDAYGKLQNAPDGGASADGVDEAPTTVIAGEFELEYVVVPCNQSVRLKFDAVQAWITVLDHALVDIIDDPLIETREWDVKLITTNSLKDDILSASISDAEKLEFLTEAQPRFMWQISYATKQAKHFACSPTRPLSSFRFLCGVRSFSTVSSSKKPRHYWKAG